MRVLSLFDGISCGMVALERAKIPVERYVAYEIDENAIKISKKNYPQIYENVELISHISCTKKYTETELKELLAEEVNFMQKLFKGEVEE